MSRGANQKFKLLYLMQIMKEKTDHDHGITMPQILKELEKYEVGAERKSIYVDFLDMTERFGIEIEKEQIGRETFYHVESREFELAEVKLLIDAIHSSKFITESKSRELIEKIKKFVSEHQAKELQRQILIKDQVKSMNKSVFYTIDDIHVAMNNNKKVRFRYLKWDISKELVPVHEGNYIEVSPWTLVWDDENYYLIAYDNKEQVIKYYRVDKMKEISLIEESRQGEEAFRQLDMVGFSKSTFGMFSGEKKRVKIKFANEKCGVMFDRFGTDISVRKVDDQTSMISVEVHVSQQFFGWLFGLGKDVTLVGPQEVVEQMKAEAELLLQHLNDQRI